MLGAGAGDAAEVWCFGGATMDRQLRAVEPLRAGDSNPVLTRSTPGGVARNVAEALARLGCRTGLVSAVGDDGDGRAIIDEMCIRDRHDDGVELLDQAGAAPQRFRPGRISLGAVP